MACGLMAGLFQNGLRFSVFIENPLKHTGTF